MQSATVPAKPAPATLLDTDMGTSIDDVLALAMLFGLEGTGESRLVAIAVSYPNLKAAVFADSVTRFYTGAGSRLLPIGLASPSPAAPDTPIIKAVLDRRDGQGGPAYASAIHSLNDTAEPHAMLRNALTAQHDQNAIAVCIGPATNLHKLLDLRGAKELIERKVRYLVMMGGSYPASAEPEYNIKTDIPAAKKVFAEWPTPVVVSGAETGNAILFPGACIEKDFTWAEFHPVVDAYRAYQSMPYDTPSWDLTAALYAVRPQENYFKLSAPGAVAVQDDGRTVFTPTTGGRHRYLIVDPAQKDRVIAVYRELVSAKPARPRRVPQPRQQEQPKPPSQVKPPAGQQ
ncbi:MAG: nucleoside hydrolase [Bryobacterales bacterium]|nr:nucleoside hydrolase [Bryobacterales bacterium]